MSLRGFSAIKNDASSLELQRVLSGVGGKKQNDSSGRVSSKVRNSSNVRLDGCVKSKSSCSVSSGTSSRSSSSREKFSLKASIRILGGEGGDAVCNRRKEYMYVTSQLILSILGSTAAQN